MPYCCPPFVGVVGIVNHLCQTLAAQEVEELKELPKGRRWLWFESWFIRNSHRHRFRYGQVIFQVLLGLGLLFCWGCFAKAPVTPQPEKTPAGPISDLTIMVYCDADNDLEAAQLNSIKEMSRALGEASGKALAHRVVVTALIDRAQNDNAAEGYTGAPLLNIPDWDGGKVFLLAHNELKELEDVGEPNMADGPVLEKFIRQSKARFPANEYVLVLMDHGDAWAGLCGDDTATNASDLLSPLEVERALSNTEFDAKHPLALLVMDACLMSNFEFLYKIRQHVSLVLSSEETIDEAGLRYSKAFLRARTRAQSSQSLAKFLALQMLEENKPKSNEDVSQLCLIDLTKIEQVAQDSAKLSEKLLELLKQDRRATWSLLSAARQRSLEFGSSSMDGVPSAEVRDVVDLCAQFSKRIPLVAEQCSALQKSVKALIVGNSKNEDLSKAAGLTIFFPPLSESTSELSSSDYYKELDENLKPWAELVRCYTQIERNEIARPELSEPQLSEGELAYGESCIVSSRVKESQNLAQCDFVLALDGRIVNATPSFPNADSTLLSDSFDGHAVVLCEQYGSHGEIWCPFEEPVVTEETDDSSVVVAAKGEFRRNGQGAWEPITLEFSIDSESGSLRGVLHRVYRTHSKLKPLSLAKGDQIRLLHRDISLQSTSPGKILTIHEPQWLVVRSSVLPAASYQVGFRIKDVSGQEFIKTVPVEFLGRN